MSKAQYGTGTRWMFVLLVIWGVASGADGYAAPDRDVALPLFELYKQAVASPIRTEADRNADAKRMPLEFLQFTGVRPGMKVLDVAAGGGYTTQLLALTVGSDGTVWAQGSKSGAVLSERLDQHPQANIVPLVRPYDDPLADGSPKLDLVTIIMSYHDIAYMPVDRAKMNRRLFDALKPGGHLVVMDHSAKSGSGISAARTLHRIDEQVVLDELRQAGFKLDMESDFMKNPDDPRDEPFFKTNIQTDKFALRFVKP